MAEVVDVVILNIHRTIQHYSYLGLGINKNEVFRLVSPDVSVPQELLEYFTFESPEKVLVPEQC